MREPRARQIVEKDKSDIATSEKLGIDTNRVYSTMHKKSLKRPEPIRNNDLIHKVKELEKNLGSMKDRYLKKRTGYRF